MVKIRISGNIDTLKQIAPGGKVYLNRGSKTEGRVYLDLDDTEALKLFHNASLLR